MKATPIRRALISVSDKSGLVEFVRELHALNIEIVSTGGTARALRDAGVPIVDIEAFTGFPEMLDGRVKTLHPRVHAGILHRRDLPAHLQTMKEHGLGTIDLVVVNLYPFEETVARPGVERPEAVEQIDIGGPSMLRSAAKNHDSVTVVSSPSQYGEVLDELRQGSGTTTLALRRRLAADVFRRTAEYDAAITSYFDRVDDGAGPLTGDAVTGDASAGGAVASGVFPRALSLVLRRDRVLRYGENPHQSAALYGEFLEGLEQLHGKALSYNNILDLAAAREMAEFLGRRGAAMVIVKHSNPCGAAIGVSAAEAWRRALATDPQSASGGIIASSVPIDVDAAEAMKGHFIEILAAPAFDADALELLRQRKNRILIQVTESTGPLSGVTLRSVPGGLLAQTLDTGTVADHDLQVVTRREPTPEELRALRFGWDVVRFVKSNAILFAGEDRTLGIGAGQMSRVDSVRLAVLKAKGEGLALEGSVVASDAFFPFPDGLLAAADAGATAAIQPGGSVRDKEVIAAADERGLAMVFTGMRHFRH